MNETDSPSFEQLHCRLASCGQEHVLRWWDTLTEQQREELVEDLKGIDASQVAGLFRNGTACDHRDVSDNDVATPSSVVPLPSSPADRKREEAAAIRGKDAIRAGEVAVVMVAGGQGSRLGHEGPKGTFPIGPVSGKSLFQIHAEKVLAMNRRYGVAMPLYIMTSPENDRAVREFFTHNGYFGLDPDNVLLFQQGMLPAVDRTTGKILLAQTNRVALSPNGHGGVVKALAEGGHLQRMHQLGIRYLYYFQVDNPLAKIADPAFLGHHIEADADISLKVVRKRTPEERLGVVVECNGRPQIIEYSDLPDLLAQRCDTNGSLDLWAGSIAVHILNLAFLERLVEDGKGLPFHRAVKSVPYIDDEGRRVSPTEPNALKFETFLFDVLPQARRVLVVETAREDEFEPLKNASGENSPQTVRQAMSRQFARWLTQAGIEVQQDIGAGPMPLEISPLFALDAEELRERLSWTGPVNQPLLLDDATLAVYAGEDNHYVVHSMYVSRSATTQSQIDRRHVFQLCCNAKPQSV